MGKSKKDACGGHAYRDNMSEWYRDNADRSNRKIRRQQKAITAKALQDFELEREDDATLQWSLYEAMADGEALFRDDWEAFSTQDAMDELERDYSYGDEDYYDDGDWGFDDHFANYYRSTPNYRNNLSILMERLGVELEVQFPHITMMELLGDNEVVGAIKALTWIKELLYFKQHQPRTLGDMLSSALRREAH